ncbi:hypothetical protein JCM8547_008449 [Rhodosporidiobolus lusitaniae]
MNAEQWADVLIHILRGLVCWLHLMSSKNAPTLHLWKLHQTHTRAIEDREELEAKLAKEAPLSLFDSPHCDAWQAAFNDATNELHAVLSSESRTLCEILEEGSRLDHALEALSTQLQTELSLRPCYLVATNVTAWVRETYDRLFHPRRPFSLPSRDPSPPLHLLVVPLFVPFGVTTYFLPSILDPFRLNASPSAASLNPPSPANADPKNPDDFRLPLLSSLRHFVDLDYLVDPLDSNREHAAKVMARMTDDGEDEVGGQDGAGAVQVRARFVLDEVVRWEARRRGERPKWWQDWLM